MMRVAFVAADRPACRMQIGEASRQEDDAPAEDGATSQDTPANSVPRVASPPGRAPLKSKTRWAACSKCLACTRSDCGDCINCADKPRFGGSGVRKQSCVRRRCLRMNANNAAARHQPSNRGRPDVQPERRGQDVAFWDAVAGCAPGRPTRPLTRPSPCVERSPAGYPLTYTLQDHEAEWQHLSFLARPL